MFVKICGITSEEDALLAVAMGADAVGFIFAPSSPPVPRRGRAADIAKRLPPEILTVGVFRDEARRAGGRDRATRPACAAAQLHGHETAEDTRCVRERVPVVIKAFPGGDPELRQASPTTAPTSSCSTRPAPARARCSTGRWPRARPSGLRLILAGGLTPDNVADAIERVRPWGVDVATGRRVGPRREGPPQVRALHQRRPGRRARRLPRQRGRPALRLDDGQTDDAAP